MSEQVLDSMDLEREKGITIKAQTATLNYKALDGKSYTLNLIDTPGHIDFSYEVSRSLAACEGALLVVDASQGVEAQTVANSYAAISLDLEIIPVLNKVDLASADPERVRTEIAEMIGIATAESLDVSAKSGLGVKELLEAVVRRVPPPSGIQDAPLRALVIDTWFDRYAGVILLVRVMDGVLRRGEKIRLMVAGTDHVCDRLGQFTPKPAERPTLSAGEVGYIISGIRDIRSVTVGDTVTLTQKPTSEALPGFRKIRPRVFASLYPTENNQYELLRDSFNKLQLNDASLDAETEDSPALGFGLRCGFLGMLHMEIIQERLRREYGAETVMVAPGVAYEIFLSDGETVIVDHPSKLPEVTRISEIREPIADVSIIAPPDHVGKIMSICRDSRGSQTSLTYSAGQAIMSWDIPLSEVITGLFNRLTSATKGYASMDYEVSRYQRADIVKLDVLVNGDPVDALAVMVARRDAHRRGRAIAVKIKDEIPRQMFDVAIQAAIGGHIVARETVKALRKNVLSKCYGGDVTRKRKLIERQKAGKKRMRQFGSVEIPQEAFLAVLRSGDEES